MDIKNTNSKILIGALSTVIATVLLMKFLFINYPAQMGWLLFVMVSIAILVSVLRAFHIGRGGVLLVGLFICAIIVTVLIIMKEKSETPTHHISPPHVPPLCEEEGNCAHPHQPTSKSSQYECFTNGSSPSDLKVNISRSKYNIGAGPCNTRDNRFGYINAINSNKCFEDKLQEEEQVSKSLKSDDERSPLQSLEEEAVEEEKQIKYNPKCVKYNSYQKEDSCNNNEGGFYGIDEKNNNCKEGEAVIICKNGYYNGRPTKLKTTKCLDRYANFDYWCQYANNDNKKNIYNNRTIGWKKLQPCLKDGNIHDPQVLKYQGICDYNHYKGVDIYKDYTSCHPVSSHTNFTNSCNKIMKTNAVVAANIDSYDCDTGFARAKCIKEKIIDNNTNYNQQYI